MREWGELFIDLLTDIFSWVSKHEKFLTLSMVFVQTAVVCIGVTVALKEFGGKEISEQQEKRAESWDIYKSNKKTENEVREFFEDYAEATKEDENQVVSLFFIEKGIEIRQMYTEFELCLSSERCDEEVLMLLACNSALQLAAYDYKNNGVWSFISAANDDKAKKYNLHLNMYRFAKRCIPTASEYDELFWKGQLDNL
ncbi:TPA: hypothetical protein NKX95_004470 [Vibrio parahaemolyticus]|nr:hypothetical protein [Vibrio parahaemolyticus]